MENSSLIVRKTALKEGTSHHVLSDLDEPEAWTPTIRWRTVSDVDFDDLLEIVLSLLEQETPQRISIPCLQQYVTIPIPAPKICQLIDDIADHIKDCPQHQVAFPTLRYPPAHFMYWPEYKLVNDHIRCRSSELSWPTLNLSRSFLMRQGATWCVSGNLYEEYRREEGFGTTLTKVAFERYHARILRFHETAFDVMVPYSTPESDPVPLSLNKTNHYIRNDYTRDLLSGLGLAIADPTDAKQQKKKANKKAAKMMKQYRELVSNKEASNKEVSNKEASNKEVNNEVVRMEVDGEEQRGVKRPMGDPSMAVPRGQTRRPGWKTVEYETMPVLKGTMADMLSQIAYLKESKRDLENQLSRERRLRKDRDADYYRHRRQLRGAEIRYGEYNRTIERVTEEHYRDNLDWKQLQEEWLEERKDLLKDLRDERRRVRVLEERVEEREGERKKNKGTVRGKE